MDSAMIRCVLVLSGLCLLWSHTAECEHGSDADTLLYRLECIAEFAAGGGPGEIDLPLMGAPFGAPTERYLFFRRLAEIDQAGNFYLMTGPFGDLVKFDSRGEEIRIIESPDTAISIPFQFILDRWDHLYVLFHGQGSLAERKFGLAKFDATGNLLFWLEDKNIWENPQSSRPHWSISINGLLFIRQMDRKTYRKFNQNGDVVGLVDYHVVDGNGYIYSLPKSDADTLLIKRYQRDAAGSKNLRDLELIDQRHLAPAGVSSPASFILFDEQGTLYFSKRVHRYEEHSLKNYPSLGYSITDYVDTGSMRMFSYLYEKDRWSVLIRNVPAHGDHKYCASIGTYITPQGKICETFLFFDDPKLG
jgi:hypothetical protein